jgi:hypothetical protein
MGERVVVRDAAGFARALAEAKGGAAIGFDVRKRSAAVKKLLAEPRALVERAGSAAGVGALHFCTADAGPGAEWMWPLDLALFDDPASQELATRLTRLRHGDVIQLMAAAGAVAPIELLVHPGSVSKALERVRAHGGLPRVQLVIVLGDGTASLDELEVLRTAARADAVCAADCDGRRQPSLLDEFLDQLGRGIDADVAFFQASRRRDAKPLLVASDGVFERARMTNWRRAVAQRVTRARPALLDAAPPGPGPLRIWPSRNAAPVEAMPRLARDVEGVEAGTLAAVGRKVKEEPPDPDARKRRVMARLADAKEIDVEHGPLAPGDYTLAVWIGPTELGAIAAAVAFPEERLPVDERGLDLKIVLSAHGILAQPLVEPLHLPPRGPSRPVDFPLTIPAEATKIEARITVLHENRIVQTLLLRAQVGSGPPSELALVVPEATIRRDLDGLGGRRRFDAALLFNDQNDAKLMTAFRDGRASTVDLARIDAVVNEIALVLEDATNRPDRHGKPNTKLTGELLGELARKGNLLLKRLLQGPTVKDDIASAKRIQIVAATPEGVLPLEICYEAAPPDRGAKVCKGWKEALASKEGGCAKSCPEDKRTVVCPVAFWATSKVIERYAYDKNKAALLGSHDFGLTGEAGASRQRLPVLAGGLCAAAKQARDAEPEAVDRAFAALKEVARSGREVKDWNAWKKGVGAGKAATLLLLAHTDVENTTSCLVIGDREIALLTEIDDRIVGKAESGNGALVLLLGCSTAVTQSALQSFIAQFCGAGSKIVVGTLCKVLGRHAAPIAEALIRGIGEAAGATQPSSLGELMPRLRRALLAEGFPIALTVTAFGDADWQI